MLVNPCGYSAGISSKLPGAAPSFAPAFKLSPKSFLASAALPGCRRCHRDGRLNISDPVATLNFLFLGVSKLPPPNVPGPDPTPDDLGCKN